MILEIYSSWPLARLLITVQKTSPVESDRIALHSVTLKLVWTTYCKISSIQWQYLLSAGDEESLA